MHTLSFIERFKRHENKKPDSEIPETTKLLRLIQALNQVPLSDPDIDRLANAIFTAFSPEFIFLSVINPTALRIKCAWISKKSHSNIRRENLIGKSASIFCENTKKIKNVQFSDNMNEKLPDDPLLNQLGSKHYTGIPVFNDDNQVIAVLSLINGQENFSKTELDALNSIAERIKFELDLTQPTELTPDNIPLTASASASDSQLQSELDIANKCIESISYTISHDLRAPLRSIDSFSSILVEDFSDKLPEDALDHLSRIRRATNRMSSLIDDLLWLAKVTRRKLSFREMDLSKAAENLLDEILEAHKEYNCEFIAEPSPLVEADKHLMKIALKNLLGNACKFSQHQEKIIISFRCLQQNNQTVYQLTDNGSGFDMAYADQLFQPFKRLHEGREFKGTGIGLATAQRIIHRHRGKIWIESEVDKGTSVFFTLGTE